MSTLRHPARSAFTLLEVLLTLSMSVVLMILIGGAIQFYGRDMAICDQEARQTQLAVALLQMIEDDLRATLHPEPIDTSGLDELLSSFGSQAGGGGQAAAGGQVDAGTAGPSAPPDDTSADTTIEAEPASTSDLTSGAAVLEEPGLIGNQYQIQIDVSRLPRLEEYYVMLDALVGNIDDLPSDLKTVSYFVQPAGTTGGVNDALAEAGSTTDELAGGGLVRRSLDRAATRFASLNGNLTALNQTGELLAPEVVSIEFSYWDGATWQIQWSSDEYGELPLAIKVTLSMSDPAAAASSTATTNTDAAIRTFQHLIRLPMAKLVEEEEEEDLAEAGI